MAMLRIANFGVRRATRRRQSARSRRHMSVRIGSEQFRVAIPTYGPKADENRKTRVAPLHACLYLRYCRRSLICDGTAPIYFAALPGSTTIVAVMRGCSEQKYS